MANRRGVLLALITAFPGLVTGQRSCAAVGISSLVVEQAVSIKTNILTNTTFRPLPDVAVVVTDAPTSIDTLTTFRWTSTVNAAPSNQPLPSTFVLMSQEKGSHNKRQSGSTYVAQDGTLTSDCAAAVQYSIINGQLIANTSDGTIYYFSTSQGVAYAPFIPTTIPGSISTVFSITTAYDLAWNNPNFYNGAALFCSVNSTVYAVFQDGQQPAGCLYAPLSPAYGPGCVLWGNSGTAMTNGDKSGYCIGDLG